MEIKSTELRIGNHLYFINTKDIAIVEIINKSYFDCRDEYGSFYPNGIYCPIPLSDEILLKCGFHWETINKSHIQLTLPDQEFNERYMSFYYEKGNITILQLHMNDYFDGFIELVAPKYLHQLQNLYFALTKTELEIRL